MSALEETPSVPLPALTPRRIAGIYLLFGFAWILFSDSLLWLLTRDSAIRLRIEAVKGLVFVAVSSGLIYWLGKRARRSHQAATQTLQKQTRELSIFHRIVRHNLRNIATVIGGRTEAARESAKPDPHLSVIERKADRLTTLAEKANLLRNVSSEEAATWVRQDLRTAIDDICQQRRTENPAATIEVTGPERLETMVPARLGFAFSELLDNAIVHAGDSPLVSVRLEAIDEEVRITVADDGPGLPDVERTAIEGDVEAVLDHSEGVGLWLVRLIVENADGRAEITDSELDGAAVTLAFPRVESAD